uniref:C2H2-type domain-containing protein n=1 Tax=Lepeophtheirus salmonis TaxID=72036 RepID=A0A0K2UI78_LEPSM
MYYYFRLLCRGLTNKEPLLNPPELLIKDAIEIRRSLDNANQANKEFITDRMIALGIIPHFSEFRSTADACIRMLHNLLSDGDRKLNKAFWFLKLKLSAFAFLPDENKSGSSKMDQYAFLRKDRICKVLCLACDENECTGCQRPAYPSPISLGDSKGRHLHYLQTTCRCCKKRTSTFHSHPRGNTLRCSSNNCKLNYTDGFKRLCDVDIVFEDDYDVHPQAVCGGCRTYLTSATSPFMSGFPNFYPHNELFCDCDLNFFYANASVQESGSCLSVVMNFSRIPSLTFLAGSILASPAKNNWINTNYLTVKMALEIYQTFMYVHNKKSPDTYEYFKTLALAGVLRYPIKVAFHNKANAFQTVLTILCDSMSHSSRENRTKFRRKLETILNADFYGTEPSLRLTKKTVKFRRNFCVIVMCVICSNLLCEGICGRIPSDPSGSTHKRAKKSSNNSNHKLFRSYDKKLGLRGDLTYKEFQNYRLSGTFVANDEINHYCVNCLNLKCKGCQNSSSDSQKENLKLKLKLEELPTKKELSNYNTTGRFVFEDDLPLINKSKKQSKSNGNFSSSSPKTNDNYSTKSIGGSKHGEFFSHCTDCKFYFRREHIYLKHLETCCPGMNSLICSTCQRHFKSEVGMLKHNCEGIYNLENHQFKNIALDLGSIEYDHFIYILLNHSLPHHWRASSGPKEETLVMEKESVRFRFVISRYKKISNKARLKGEGVKAFKEEIWPIVAKLAIPGEEEEDGDDDDLEEEEDEYELKCAGCHLDNFSTLSELDKHQVECQDYQNVADLWECDGCDKVFSYETEYIKHIKTCEVIEIPEDIRSFYPDDKGRIFCPGCSQVFIDDELEYFRHLKMCRFVEFENYPCKKCKLKFSTQKTLLAHDCSNSYHINSSPPAVATITSNSKRHSTSPIPQNFGIKKSRIEELNLFNDNNTSTTPYQPICKMGDYKCPICGLKFTLNQPYGNHVKNTMCVSLNSSVVPYEYKHIKTLRLKFASISFNSNYDNDGSSIIMKITYSRVPSLMLLCCGLLSPKKLIKNCKVPPLSIKDALELYQSLNKSFLDPESKVGALERDRFWERIRLSFYHGFGDFESFEKCLEKQKRILGFLITRIRSSSPTKIVWNHWLSKIKMFILAPLHDQFMEEAGSFSDHEERSFKVIEYPFMSESNCKSIIQHLCLQCWDSVCVGCSGEIHQEDYYEKELCTISQTLFFKEFGVICTSEKLFNECTQLGMSLDLKRRASIHELIQYKKGHKIINGTQFEKGGIKKLQATTTTLPLQNNHFNLEKIKKENHRISVLSKAAVSSMPWLIDEECILPD